MYSFLGCLALLVIGFLVYGKLVDTIFKPTDEPTPAVRINDGVDYIPLPTWKVFMIQLLNIAGLGPIFGALGGALWGPSVYLWIVFGTIFAGGVHDYMSGMISLRENGKSISEVVGHYLGSFMLHLMRLFSVVLLVLVGNGIHDRSCQPLGNADGHGPYHVAARCLGILLLGNPFANRYLDCPLLSIVRRLPADYGIWHHVRYAGRSRRSSYA